MADMRRRVICIVVISFIMHACMVMHGTALASGNSDASLNAAEKLLTEALKKEINDELKGTATRSSNGKMEEASDTDVLADVLEEAIKEVGSNYAGAKWAAAKDRKAMGHRRIGLKKDKFKISKAQEKSKMSLAGVPPGLKRHVTKQTALNNNLFRAQDREVLMDGLEMPTRNDGVNKQLYQSILRSLQQHPSQLDSGSRHHNPNNKEHHSPKFANKNLYSSNAGKAMVNSQHAVPPETHSKIVEDWHQLSDDDIESKITEYYNILQDYADEMQTVYGQKDRASQHHALPLDQPLQLSSTNHGGKQKQVAWQQKRTEDNQKLVADLEQLAKTLTKAERDSSNDAFPSFAQWFRHQRSLTNSRKAKDTSSYFYERLHQAAAADALRGAEASDLGINYPWSKYFRDSKNADQSDYLKTKREATDSDDKNFIDELETRVTELQRQLDAKRHKKEGATLKM